MLIDNVRYNFGFDLETYGLRWVYWWPVEWTKMTLRQASELTPPEVYNNTPEDSVIEIKLWAPIVGRDLRSIRGIEYHNYVSYPPYYDFRPRHIECRVSGQDVENNHYEYVVFEFTASAWLYQPIKIETNGYAVYAHEDVRVLVDGREQKFQVVNAEYRHPENVEDIEDEHSKDTDAVHAE